MQLNNTACYNVTMASCKYDESIILKFQKFRNKFSKDLSLSVIPKLESQHSQSFLKYYLHNVAS